LAPVRHKRQQSPCAALQMTSPLLKSCSVIRQEMAPRDRLHYAHRPKSVRTENSFHEYSNRPFVRVQRVVQRQHCAVHQFRNWEKYLQLCAPSPSLGIPYSAGVFLQWKRKSKKTKCH